MVFDRASFYYASCTSTLDKVQPYIRHTRVAEGTVFVADYQSKGRGQRGNKWVSLPKKNLLFTLVLYPEWLSTARVFSLNIIASLAIYEAIAEKLPEGLSIKWPNDIYYKNQKLGGILIDIHIRHGNIHTALVSAGLNINQLHFEDPCHATSLALHLGVVLDRTLILNQILNLLGKYYSQLKDNADMFWVSYRDKLYRKSGWHLFKTLYGFLEGRIVDVNTIGQLVIETGDGVRHLYNNKEVIFI